MEEEVEFPLEWLPSVMIVENSTPTEQHQCWRRPFTKVLNVRSQFDGAELAEVRQRETDANLGTVPTSAEVVKALGKLKNGKAPGSKHLTRNAGGWRWS